MESKKSKSIENVIEEEKTGKVFNDSENASELEKLKNIEKTQISVSKI